MKQPRQASLQRDAFLFCLSQTGNFTISADFAGLSSYELRQAAALDTQFANAINNAFGEACDRLLYVAFERAVKGVVVPHFYQGEEVGSTQKPSDSLLRFLLERAAQQQDVAQDNAQDEADFERLRATLSKKLAQMASQDDAPTTTAADSESK